MTNNNRKPIYIICLTVIIVALIISGTIIFLSVNNSKNNDKTYPQSSESSTVDLTEEESTTKKQKITTSKKQPDTTAQEKSTSVAAQSNNSWENAPADKLYRPDSAYFVNQYNATVFCIDVDVQDYVKMRLGPSKSKFNTAGIIIPNYESVTVQTKSVNGWTLCFYNGTEGWIRTDFIFENKNDVPTHKTQEACKGAYIVSVTGEYAGEPLNMRKKPTRESKLVTTVSDGSVVEIGSNNQIVDGWVYVSYNDKTKTYNGYVLYKYLKRAEGVGDKPVLYLYPEKEQKVNVKIDLAPNMNFYCTYPKYDNCWEVIAKPNGKIINTKDNREYNYLYWDLVGEAQYDFSEGFCVKGEDTAAFLEKILAEIGLTPYEANEFIVYWLPKMQNNEYNLISFQSKAYTDNVKLDINPKPDCELRVFMAYKKIDAPIEVTPQKFKPFSRKGFSAVEWGGAEVN